MKYFGIACVVLLLLTGCPGTQTEKAAKAMLVTQTAIVDVATTANNLCVAGVLSQNECDDIADMYEKAKVTYDLAESALATALQTDSDDSWQKYQTFHENFMKIYIDMLTAAASYGILEE